MRIRIRIDSLVLHSVSALEEGGFREGFESEFTGLLAARGIPAAMGAPWRSDRLVMPAPPAAASAEDVGRACARYLYEAFA